VDLPVVLNDLGLGYFAGNGVEIEFCSFGDGSLDAFFMQPKDFPSFLDPFQNPLISGLH
jgi:hypothetical protein